jgi:hypothetical protein
MNASHAKRQSPRPSGQVGTETAQAVAPEGHGAGHAHVVADRVWLVLARRGYEEPLRQVGTVTADDADLARVYARTIYDEFAWIEMVVVPRDTMITVIEA